MKNDQKKTGRACRYCGSDEAQAAADARALGFEKEFQYGVYSCCQVVQWADEQWQVWVEAATERRKANR
jgi:hypothetical protein